MTTKAPILSRYPDFEGLIADGEDEDLSINLRRTRPLRGARRREVLGTSATLPGRGHRSRFLELTP